MGCGRKERVLNRGICRSVVCFKQPHVQNIDSMHRGREAWGKSLGKLGMVLRVILQFLQSNTQRHTPILSSFKVAHVYPTAVCCSSDKWMFANPDILETHSTSSCNTGPSCGKCSHALAWTPFQELGQLACSALLPLSSVGSHNSPVTKFLSCR